MDIICPIWLPQAKVPIMEAAFKRVKAQLNEPDLEWSFSGKSYWDETPVVFLRGASEKRKEEIRLKIIEKRLDGRWPAGAGHSELGKILSERWHRNQSIS